MKAEHKVVWNVDIAKIIQAIGMLVLLIYGMYHGYNKVDDFLDLRQAEIQISALETAGKLGMTLESVYQVEENEQAENG